MHWCDRDDIETWTGTLANFAGFLPIRNLVSPVTCAIAYQGVIPFFTVDAMYIANFVGHPLSFAANKVIDGIGAAGKFAVCGAAGRLYGINNRGIWTSDLGGNYQYFDIPLVRDFLISSLNAEQIAHHPVAWHNRVEHSIVFYYPTANVHSNNRGLMFNYQEGNWTSLSVGRNAVDDTGIFDYALAGDKDGNLFFQAAPGQIGTEDPLPGTGVPGFLPIVTKPKLYRAGFGIGPFGAFAFGGPADG